MIVCRAHTQKNVNNYVFANISYIRPIKVTRKSRNNPTYEKMTFVMASVVSPDKIEAKTYTVLFDSLHRVVLRYNQWNNDKQTAKILVKCVPIIKYDWALELSKMAKMNGTAIVVTVPQPEATMYCDRLNNNGLTAFVEEA